MGAKKNPFYRIVVADSRAPRDGRFIEVLGNYDPSQNPAVVNVDEEKVLDWMGKGAQPTDTVKNLFSKKGLMAKFAEAKNAKN
jgi:small subunit ribosomal protein S16